MLLGPPRASVRQRTHGGQGWRPTPRACPRRTGLSWHGRWVPGSGPFPGHFRRRHRRSADCDAVLLDAFDVASVLCVRI